MTRNRHARRTLVAFSAVCVLLVAGCSDDSTGVQVPNDQGSESLTVMATDQYEFVPASITIPVGQTVTWENTGSLPETVTFDPTRAAVPGDVMLPGGAEPFYAPLGAGRTFSHTFEAPGQYSYVSEPHELQGMVGTITVEP